MSGIYYALSILAVFVVIRWFIANDKIGSNEPTTGLLAIRHPGKPEGIPSGKTARRAPFERAKSGSAAGGKEKEDTSRPAPR